MARDYDDVADVLCPACDFGPFQRNAYWTGKLLVAGDFIAEQRYFIEKLRHHNLHLHGSGAVCGLKVVAHANDACRDRFVCVEPGTAIDCCGHEIVLKFKECIDLETIPAVKALKDKGDTGQHILQVCIRYRECETETVPVLYDECGCDQDRCAPNRILESCQLDVMVLDTLPPKQPTSLHCADYWKYSVEGCAHCDQPDCIVLATIAPYVVGNKIIDAPVPPATVPAGSAAIDNYTGRQILPSAQLIKEVIDCMLQQGPGAAGPPGKGIDEVDATFVPCQQPGSAKIDETGSIRKLVLEVPRGCDGAGLEKDLTRIDRLSWTHGTSGNALAAIHPASGRGLDRKGLVVGFTRHVLVSPVDADHVFQVLIESDVNAQLGLRCRCPLAGGEVVGVKNVVVAGGIITEATVATAQDAEALAFLLPARIAGSSPLGKVLNSDRPELWVVLRCDFVIDTDKRAVDGNFVRAELPTGDLPAPPAPAPSFGIQGGTFESWFAVKPTAQ
jgi:hypothetical protein